MVQKVGAHRKKFYGFVNVPPLIPHSRHLHGDCFSRAVRTAPAADRLHIMHLAQLVLRLVMLRVVSQGCIFRNSASVL